jgi:hypothetical protein
VPQRRYLERQKPTSETKGRIRGKKTSLHLSLSLEAGRFTVYPFTPEGVHVYFIEKGGQVGGGQAGEVGVGVNAQIRF